MTKIISNWLEIAQDSGENSVDVSVRTIERNTGRNARRKLVRVAGALGTTKISTITQKGSAVYLALRNDTIVMNANGDDVYLIGKTNARHIEVALSDNSINATIDTSAVVNPDGEYDFDIGGHGSSAEAATISGDRPAGLQPSSDYGAHGEWAFRITIHGTANATTSPRGTNITITAPQLQSSVRASIQQETSEEYLTVTSAVDLDATDGEVGYISIDSNCTWTISVVELEGN